MKKAELEAFQKYIFEMDDVLEEFCDEYVSKGYMLDYSLESLDEIEKIVVKDSLKMSDEKFSNRAARYIGEVFRRNIGGNWDVCQEIRNIYDGLPVITNFAEVDIEFCPLAIMGNYFARKQPGLLKGAVESNKMFGKKA